MKNKFLATGALVASAALVLTACTGGGRGTTPTETSAPTPAETSTSAPTETEAPAAAGTFDKGSKIGVALPDKTSENWTRAGAIFEEQLTAAGYEPDIQYAADGADAVASQQQQIEALITGGAKVIVIGAKDGGQLGAQVEKAKAAGVHVIAYDRLILNTSDVDYYVAFDNEKVGNLQGEALLKGLEETGRPAPWNIELFSGSADDANSGVFFQGAMDILQPKIDDGTLVVNSGQTDQKATETAGWKPENAQTRMENLLTANYADKTLDGVLSPNDTLARAIVTAAETAGKNPLPIVTGQDSEEESLHWINDGKQYQTINKSTPVLIAETIKMIDELQATGKATTNNDTDYNNGVKIVPAYLLPPISVTKENLKTAYDDDPKLKAVVDQF